jgi:hypothetical protein
MNCTTSQFYIFNFGLTIADLVVVVVVVVSAVNDGCKTVLLC